MNLVSLIEVAKTFDLPQKDIDLAEAGRLEFISKFPLEKIKELTIDQYAQGTDHNSFTYWLEFKKILFGIGGGNASKFGIYKAKDGKYYTSFAKRKRQLIDPELSSFFEKIKSGILSALSLTERNQIEKIKEIDIPIWNMVLQKILSIYYPDKFITIGASDVLIRLAKDIELTNIDLSPKNLIQINFECKKKLDSHEIFNNWNYEKTGNLIWQNFKIEKKTEKDSNRVTKEDYREAYKQYLDNVTPNDSGKKSSYVRAIDILSEITENDIFKDNNISKFEVLYEDLLKEQKNDSGKYYYKDAPSYGNSGFYSAAIRTYIDFLREFTTQMTETINPDFQAPLNKILYGPPGTGKTYVAILRAAEIVEKRTINSYDEALIVFKKNLHERIEFITFHQNYSYEDFIQGLRPSTDNKSTLIFNKKDGIFKSLADKALENLRLSLQTPEDSHSKVEQQNYVIVIDEINRANISRVFGELITLIEPDKRSHGTIPLEARLPSGDTFIVPSNLYIIGTMNTADKSIALLDIALRRRFEFEPMYPDYSIEGIKDIEILKKINNELIRLKGFDFQIGHSYFMGSKDDPYNLVKRINKKIIPLMLEYFMNNRDEVAKIIKSAGLNLKNDSWPLEITE